jgi:hypothetical protein
VTAAVLTIISALRFAGRIFLLHGVQRAVASFRALRDQCIPRLRGFDVSVGGKGNCRDKVSAETAIVEYINGPVKSKGLRNPRRRDSALRWKSPESFEWNVA